MGHKGGENVLAKGQMCCIYQNRTPDHSARRIKNKFWFTIIVITDFKLTGLELEILKLNDERYTIYETKNLY